jgi:hypothetical protein
MIDINSINDEVFELPKLLGDGIQNIASGVALIQSNRRFEGPKSVTSPSRMSICGYNQHHDRHMPIGILSSDLGSIKKEEPDLTNEEVLTVGAISKSYLYKKKKSQMSPERMILAPGQSE